MLDRVVRKDVRVANPLGLHIRPAYLIPRLAGQYESSVEIIKDGQSVNGKSVLEILMLAATEETLLTIARGPERFRPSRLWHRSLNTGCRRKRNCR